MWWIREFREGGFIPCNTAQLIGKCALKNAFFFAKKKQKQKYFICVKKLLVTAVVVSKKAKGTCLIGEKLQPKSHSNLFLGKCNRYSLCFFSSLKPRLP